LVEGKELMEVLEDSLGLKILYIPQLYSFASKTMELYLKFLFPEEVNMYEKKEVIVP